MIDSSINLPGWFSEPGAYVLVDGQFGSTGKGLMAAVIAGWAMREGRIPNYITTNAGPNSGHTAFRDNGTPGGEKIMTQQIPVASVFFERAMDNTTNNKPVSLLGRKIPTTLLNAGAVIDPDILNAERQFSRIPPSRLLIHPNAAVITEMDRADDQATLRAIAGTGKGIGPAIANKVRRRGRVAYEEYRPMLPAGFMGTWDRFWDWSRDVVFVETAQGFSLGLNTARFYPAVTSRECTVGQALSDARIPASRLRKSIACFRTFPIRVGNTQGSSGGCYEDQIETSWDTIGQAPELTTVTKRVRRVFSWSRIQFKECVAANEPDVLLINFMNYLSDRAGEQLLNHIIRDYREVMGRAPDAILTGYGPFNQDVKRYM